MSKPSALGTHKLCSICNSILISFFLLWTLFCLIISWICPNTFIFIFHVWRCGYQWGLQSITSSVRSKLQISLSDNLFFSGTGHIFTCRDKALRCFNNLVGIDSMSLFQNALVTNCLEACPLCGFPIPHATIICLAMTYLGVLKYFFKAFGYWLSDLNPSVESCWPVISQIAHTC